MNWQECSTIPVQQFLQTRQEVGKMFSVNSKNLPEKQSFEITQTTCEIPLNPLISAATWKIFSNVKTFSEERFALKGILLYVK